MPEYLFAYGTLQPNLAPASIRPVVERFRRVDGGTVRGRLFDLGSYPGATFDAGGGSVFGTVFELPSGAGPVVLAALDAYEGVPDLYRREAVTAMLSDGRTLTCWAYAFTDDPSAGRPIPSGTYVPEHRP